MVDGAAMLREIEAHPERPVLLPHDQAVAVARALAGYQAQELRQRRLDMAVGQMIGSR